MRLIELSPLFESRIDNIIKSRGEFIERHVHDFEGKKLSAQEVLAKLATGDPTSQSKNIQWLTNQYLKRMFRLEDMPRVKTELKQFMSIQKKLKVRDMNRYTYHELADVVDKEFNNVSIEAHDSSEEYGPDIQVLYNGPLGLLAIPKTQEASMKLGSGTKWCTSGREDNMFDHYNEQGPLYVWKDKSGDKFQFHINTTPFEDGDTSGFQFMNAKDVPLSPSEIVKFKSHPVVGKLLKQFEAKILQNPDLIISYAADVLKSRWPEGEKVIIKDGKELYQYAIEVINGRWPEAEKLIAKQPNMAYSYAAYIIKGRWPEAEDVIKSQPKTGYWYALKVIKGRWPEAEDVIKSNPSTAQLYASKVIKGRWPEAEDVIMTDPTESMWYAIDVLNERWPEAENVISKNPPAYEKYKTHFNIE